MAKVTIILEDEDEGLDVTMTSEPAIDNNVPNTPAQDLGWRVYRAAVQGKITGKIPG